MQLLNSNKYYKFIFSCLIFGLYLLIMYYTRDFASSRYQIRVATALYALSYFFPFLLFPLASANMLSNFLIGNLGIWDIVGGFMVGFLTTYLISQMGQKKINYLWVAAPIVFIPSLGVPIWLSSLKDLPYFALFVTVSIGQVFPATLGMLLTSCIQFLSEKSL